VLIETILLAATLATPAPPARTVPAAAPLPVPSPAAGVPPNVTLQQAIDIAVAKSPVLAAARANYQLTQIPVQLARTAIFPNLSAVATTSRSNNGTSGTAAGRFGGSFTSRGINAQLRQLIYDGGKVIAQIHQARANAVAGTQTYERQLETLSLNVAQAYYAALQAEATTQVDRQLVRLNQANEALVRAQVRIGVAPRVDLITAHVPVVQAQVALIRAQGTQASALGAFANQLGLDANTLVRPVNNTPANPAAMLVKILPYDQALARALALRPDYLSAQSAVLAAQYNVQAQRAGYFPTLNGSASYGTNSTTVNGTNFTPSSSTGLTLTIPLYDQGVTRAQVSQAQSQLDLASAQLAQTKLGVQLNVQQALVGVISDQAAVAQTQAALASAQESLRATQAQYRAGVTNLFSLLQAQTNLTSAQTDELNAVYTLRQAEQTYIFALGESSINPASP
jgi:outer membrane protein